MMNLEEMNNAVDEGVQQARKHRGCMTTEQAVSVVAEDYNMNDTEYRMFLEEVKFWFGSEK